MKKVFILLFVFLFVNNFLSAREIYVAVNGKADNSGTIDSPYGNIQQAVDEAQPGDVIYLREGTYKPTKRIKIEKAGTENARISLFGYPGERAIIDGSAMKPGSTNEFKQSRCIYVNHFGNYWHFKNLEMCNALDNGMKLEGSYNIVENCKFYDNNDSGLQIGMYKDFSIEETTSFPISGTPQYNPGYTYCRYNVVINCDSYNNYDSVQYGGKSDDGGDADGFAAKLFPGPGTEFHGCRAWNNSDDNWDLYMVYHPILIKDCWAWKGGYDKNNIARGNGNGFKLGGGGTSGGAAFSQSVGAHVVMNCISFDNLEKGFDQNNAYEAMYLFNNIAWNNKYNYRFPTVFEYGTMYMRNNIGWGAKAVGSKKQNVGNHEFLSADKPGAQVPNTDYNSWTTIDGCNPYKEGIQDANKNYLVTSNHSAQFVSLSVDLAKAERQADGSLPENDFCKLVDNSYFIDKGQIIQNFEAAKHLPDAQTPLHYASIKDITIAYAGASADMGTFEYGDPTQATLKLISSTNTNAQTVYVGTEITPIVYKWGGAATGVTVNDLPNGVSYSTNNEQRTVTITGNPAETKSYTVLAVGGAEPVSLSGTITVSTIAPATIVCTSANMNQTINVETAIQDIVIEFGGGATGIQTRNLPEGLTETIEGNTLTISGSPKKMASFTVTATGGMTPVSLSGRIGLRIPTEDLIDWYNFQDAELPKNIAQYVSFSTVGSTIKPDDTGVFGNCTKGYLNLDYGDYVLFTLPNVSELKLRWCTSGTKRPVEISFGKTGTDESSWKKVNLTNEVEKSAQIDWDVLALAGITDSKSPISIKIKSTRTTSGAIRITDLYAKIYDEQFADYVIEEQEEQISSIPGVADKKANFLIYQTETALVVQGEVAALKVYSLSGHIVSSSQWSQLTAINHLSAGIYVVLIEGKDGSISSQKFVKR